MLTKQLGLHNSSAKRRKVLILFKAERHVRFNFGDAISDLDVALRICSSFSNSYFCVETVD